MMFEQISMGDRAIIFTDRLDQLICDASGMVRHAKSHIGSIDAIIEGLGSRPDIARIRESSEWLSLLALIEFAEDRATGAVDCIAGIVKEVTGAASIGLPSSSSVVLNPVWQAAVDRYEKAKDMAERYGREIHDPARARIDEIDGRTRGEPLMIPIGHAASPEELEAWRTVAQECDRLEDERYEALVSLMGMPAPDLAALGYKVTAALEGSVDLVPWQADIDADAERLRRRSEG